MILGEKFKLSTKDHSNFVSICPLIVIFSTEINTIHKRQNEIELTLLIVLNCNYLYVCIVALLHYVFKEQYHGDEWALCLQG